MSHKLHISASAQGVIDELAATTNGKKKLKKVLKALRLLEADPKHPGLETHKYQTKKSAHEADLFESYIENRTPGAWRMWWQWGPGQHEITIVEIGPHP